MRGAKLFKSSPATMAFLFAILGCFYLLLKLLNYSFIPLSEIGLNLITSSFVIWLTVNGIRGKNEKTKIFTVLTLVLPLIAIFFLVAKGVASGLVGRAPYVYVAHSYITLLCSMIAFFSYGHGKIVKISLGILYSVLLVPIFFILFIMIFFWNFGANTVVKSELSPNGMYLAEIIDSDQGALGGATRVNVTRQNRNINLLIGTLQKDSLRIYTGKWGEFKEISLRWETDHVLYVNEIRYVLEE